MKKLSFVTASLLALAATTATAEDKIRAKLTGFQEVPSVSTAGTGLFEAVINEAGTHIDWQLTYSGMQADVTQAHIHVAQRAANGGIVLWLCKTAATPAGATNNICPARAGTVGGTLTGADVQNVATQQFATGELDEVIAAIRAGVAYANVHTTVSPGGEIRGQLRTPGMHGGGNRGGDHRH